MKINVWHSIEQRIHWLVAFLSQNTHFVPKTNILNTWQKLICVEKTTKNNILREHFPQLNVFLTICFSQGSAATDLRGGGRL